MKINDAIRGLSAIAFDSSPIIYFIERNPTYLEKMRSIMKFIANGDLQGTASVLLLMEVLVHPKKSNNTKLATKL